MEGRGVRKIAIYLAADLFQHRDRTEQDLCRFPFGVTRLSVSTDREFIQSLDFLWKVLAITLVSCLPLYVLKFLTRRFSPPSYTKLT